MFRDVAQLGSAPGSGPGGHGFEPRRSDHFYYSEGLLHTFFDFWGFLNSKEADE